MEETLGRFQAQAEANFSGLPGLLHLLMRVFALLRDALAKFAPDVVPPAEGEVAAPPARVTTRVAAGVRRVGRPVALRAKRATVHVCAFVDDARALCDVAPAVAKFLNSGESVTPTHVNFIALSKRFLMENSSFGSFLPRKELLTSPQ